MGTDQGKLGNMHALGIIADTAGVKMGELGTTTFRPPYTPLTFGTIVGRNVGEYFDIFRRTPMNDWHVEIKLNLKMWVNGRELGTILLMVKACMKLFKGKV
jgi:sarcosine oxidase subunit alpha